MAMSDFRILFLTHPYPNYVPDLLLHGLRKLLGPDVVDYPRKDSLYTGQLFGISPDDQLCPQWFPPDQGDIDREDIPDKIKSKYYTFIICDVRLAVQVYKQQNVGGEVYYSACFQGVRSIPLFADTRLELPQRLVLIDGEDHQCLIPPGPYVVCQRERTEANLSIPLLMALPEEIWEWISSLNGCSKSYDIGFIGGNRNFSHGENRKELLTILADRYPNCLLNISSIPTLENPNPDGRITRHDYYLNLQKCKIVLSLRGEGYDTFRFWENAACNAVHISQRTPFFIPYDFEHGVNILRFSDLDQLIRGIDMTLNNEYDVKKIIQKSHKHLLKYHTTAARALYFLDQLVRLLR